MQEVIGTSLETQTTGLIPDFTQLETRILEGSLEGQSVRTISIRLKVPQAYVRQLLNKPKVKAYLREVKEAVAQTTQLKLQAVLSGVLEAQMDNVDSLDELTKKDPIEVMRLLADISNQIMKGQQQAEETDKYANILSAVMKD